MTTKTILSELVLSGVEVAEVNNKVLSTKCKVLSISHLILCTIFFALTTHNSFAQNLGVNATGATPNASSIIDLNTGNTFTSPNGKGLLPPNVALTGITDAVTVTSPATSLLVYNLATNGTGNTAVYPGYYYWDGTKWVGLQTFQWKAYLYDQITHAAAAGSDTWGTTVAFNSFKINGSGGSCTPATGRINIPVAGYYDVVFYTDCYTGVRAGIFDLTVEAFNSSNSATHANGDAITNGVRSSGTQTNLWYFNVGDYITVRSSSDCAEGTLKVEFVSF